MLKRLRQLRARFIIEHTGPNRRARRAAEAEARPSPPKAKPRNWRKAARKARRQATRSRKINRGRR